MQTNEDGTFSLEYSSKASDVYLIQTDENGKETEMEIEDNMFKTPVQKGIYYYDY